MPGLLHAAYLRAAYLRAAYLRSAYLRAAYLRAAYLRKVPAYLWVVVGLAFAYTVAMDVRQVAHKAVYDPNDFAGIYAGAICATHACNPYSVPDLDAVLVKERGTDVRQQWADQLPIYPPTTLLLLSPFSFLTYGTATTAWYLLSFSIYIAGLLWAFLFSPYLRGESFLLRSAAVLIGLHFPKLMQCLGFGNPSVMVTGLMLFAVFDDARSRYVPRVVCAGVACLLKPPLALPLMLLVLFRDRTRVRFAWICGGVYAALVAGMLLYAGLPSGMHHWGADLMENIGLGERGGMNPSARISPSNVLLNLATLPGYFTRNSQTILAFTLVVAGSAVILFCVALARLYKRDDWSAGGYAAAVPAAAVLTLLPVYHRFCDIGMILFVLPWMIQRLPGKMHWHRWAAAPMLFLLYFSWERRVHFERMSGAAQHLVEFLYYRGDALLLLALTGVLISAMYTEPGCQRSKSQRLIEQK